jgi:hypothetical protein
MIAEDVAAASETQPPTHRTPMRWLADRVATSVSRRRSEKGRHFRIALVLSIAIVGGCESAPTPNPMIESPVEPAGAGSITGLASLIEYGSGSLGVHVSVEPTDLQPLTAELRRGGCESNETLVHLGLLDPADPFVFVGDVEGTLASIRPVAVIVLDPTGQPIGCASFPGP